LIGSLPSGHDPAIEASVRPMQRNRVNIILLSFIGNFKLKIASP
jgi:hypothetical protein